MIELNKAIKSETWEPDNTRNIQSFKSSILQEFFDKGYDYQDAIELLSELITGLPYYNKDADIFNTNIKELHSQVIIRVINNLDQHLMLDKSTLKSKL